MRLVVGEVWAAKCEGVGYGRKDNMTRTLLLRLTSQPPTHSRLLLAQVIGPKNLQALWQVGTLAGWDAGMLAPRNSGTQALRQQQATQPQSHKATKPQFQPPAPRFQPPTSLSSLLRKHNTNDSGPATPAPCLRNTVAVLLFSHPPASHEKWLKRVCDIDTASDSSHSPFVLACAPLVGRPDPRCPVVGCFSITGD
jgi:hypothetical protein